MIARQRPIVGAGLALPARGHASRFYPSSGLGSPIRTDRSGDATLPCFLRCHPELARRGRRSAFCRAKDLASTPRAFAFNDVIPNPVAVVANGGEGPAYAFSGAPSSPFEGGTAASSLSKPIRLLALCVIGLFAISPGARAQNAPPNPAANNLASPSASAAQLPAAWANWKYSRLIDLPSALPASQTERLVKLRLPAEIFAHAQHDLADLRVIDDLGAQTPYFLRIASGQTRTAIVRSRQLESSFVPGQYTQIILDAGSRAPFYNSLELAAPLENFSAWARIEASDDARVWRQLAAPEPIYRFAQKPGASEMTLNFSPTNARYLRLRIFYKPAKFEVTGITIRHTIAMPREDVTVATISDASAAQQNGKTVFHADLGYPLPLDSVRITSTVTDFDRTVEIYSSDDDQHWGLAGAGEINEFATRLPPPPQDLAASSADAPDQTSNEISGDALHIALNSTTRNFDRLALRFGAPPARYWRVEIQNGNDAPLSNASAQLSLSARDVFFRKEPGRSYSLIYGQSQLHGEPFYDLSRTLTDAQMNSAFAAWAIGPERANPAWQDPRPWTERHSIVLWLAVILAALALTFLAIQSLKGSQRPSAPPPPST